MNITKKLIITDTNIITDLDNANLLEKFILIDNVYISDMVKNDEINSKSCNLELVSKFKVMSLNEEELMEAINKSSLERKLSVYDLINFILARDNNGVLATGDNRLKNYSEKNGVKVIRTLKIIKLMIDNNIISYEEGINACKSLKENRTTRIPLTIIDSFISDLENEFECV